MMLTEWIDAPRGYPDAPQVATIENRGSAVSIEIGVGLHPKIRFSVSPVRARPDGAAVGWRALAAMVSAALVVFGLQSATPLSVADVTDVTLLPQLQPCLPSEMLT